MKEYMFDLGNIRSLDDWWTAYVETVGGDGSEFFGRNLDAYSDSLDGGPGCPVLPCRFVFLNKGKVKNQGLIMWTQEELEKKKVKCHSNWVPIIEMQLLLLKDGIGENLHHWILDPLMGHDGIEVIVKNGA
jgi:RNAse (barnase) inhibitor barstar